jgi:hypothetical protein
MAFEELWGPLVVMFMLAVFLFPAVYLLDVIRQKADPKTNGKKFLLLAGISYLLAMALYPFAIPEEFLPFNSVYTCYGMALAVIFVVYLIVFNKTKE